MKKLFYGASLLCIAVLGAASCEKEKRFEIPEKLDGTVWECYDMDRKATCTMSFTDATHAVYTRTAVGEDTENAAAELKYEYTYVYAMPEVRMTPLTEGAPELSGKVLNNPKEYNCITLSTADGENFFSAFSNYYGNYFGWQTSAVANRRSAPAR